MIPRDRAGALLGPGGVLHALSSPHRRYCPECRDFPGGHAEPGDSASAALRREQREEIGSEVEVSGNPRLHVEDSEADGGLDEWVGYFGLLTRFDELLLTCGRFAEIFAEQTS